MKKKYLIIPLILISIISLILTHYYLSKPKRYNIKVNNLKYALIVAGILNDTVKIPANTIIKPAIVIKSYNNKKANYELLYDVYEDSTYNKKITKPKDLLISYTSDITDEINGVITPNGTRTISLIIENKTNKAYYLKFDLNSDTTKLVLQNEFTKTEDNVMIAAYIDGELTTSFPTTKNYTATVSCKVGTSDSSASASVTWNGSKWVLNVTGADSGNTKCNITFITTLDSSGANAPLLATNMIPVYYDNTNDVWRKADSNNKNISYKWYDYNAQMWANAVTVTSSTRSTYNSAAVGTQIPMSDIMGMWVWIPRYEYLTTNLGTSYAGGTQALPGGITINFISGTSTSTTSSSYKIPPAFRNGTLYKYSVDYDLGGWDHEITGFWVAKFETGTIQYLSSPSSQTPLTSNIYIKPDLYSYVGTPQSTIFATAQNVQADHGIGSNIETHMLKNDEWGAIAYLTQSTYGKYGNSNFTGAYKAVYINNAYYGVGGSYYYYTTGRSNGTYPGGSGSASAQYGTYEYNNCPASSYTHVSCTESVRNANATKGTGASSTGNIYGIYDLVGGDMENTMGNYQGTAESSGFTTFPSQKYWNKYTSITRGSECNGSPCYGHAMSEISSSNAGGNYAWYNNYYYLPSTDYGKWIYRGSNTGPGDFTTSIGLFSMSKNVGEGSLYGELRVIIS
jgi:hypothetical protein